MCSQVFNSFTTNIKTPYYFSNSIASIPVAKHEAQTQASTTDKNVVNEKTLGVAALLQSIAIAIQKGSQWLARKLEAGKEFTSFENVKRIVSNMVSEHKLGNVTIDYISDANKAKYTGSQLAKEIEVVAQGKNAFYADALKLAVAPKSKPSLILHELGHASNSKNFFMQILQKSRKYAMAAPMALLALSKFVGRKDENKPNFIERNAGILGFSAFLPTIIEEGMASLKGIKAISKTPKELLKGAVNSGILKRNYLLALGTYVLAGIGLGVASKQAILENSTLNNRLTKN